MAAPKLEFVKNPDRMASYWKSQWKVVAVIIGTGILFNGSMSVGPILQGRLIDAIVSNQPLQGVLTQAGLFAGIVLLIQIMRFFKRYSVRVFANRTIAVMRMMIYNNVMNRDFTECSNEHTGDLMTRSISDVDICVEGMRKVTTEVFDTGVLMLSFLITLFAYDWKITIGSCVFVPVAMWIAKRLKTVITRFSREARIQNSRVADLTYDNIEHTVLLRVNGLEEKTRQDYFRELDDLETKSVKANILENSMQPVYNVIASLGIIAVLYFGGKNVLDNVWTVGMFSTYIVLFAALTTKASKAAKLFNSFQKATVSWQRVKPYFTEYREKAGSDRGKKGDGSLEVRDLGFCFPDNDDLIVRHISFFAKPGELVGVTGPIACGKSSLGIALEGLYPYIGSIKLDGIELKEYNGTERSNRISYLGHQTQLLSDTIYNNVTLGVEGDISKVLNDVCFDEDLKAMPEGVDTVVGSSGIRLSGGQQARIALARALYRHSPLMVLDDPFSAVDMETEKAVIENIRKHYKDSIIILISHRLSVFPGTDRVLVLHGDRKAEYGTHSSLMSSSALYSSVFNLQMGGNGNGT